jgi:peptidyl-prolyl isomerase E (cyclophilin E)
MAASTKITTSTEISSDFSKVTLHSRRALYVGGLADEVTEETLRAAFLPFGPLKSVEMPRDYTKGTPNRGFGFVEFECPDDAEEAIFNMDGAEIMGKAITVNLAQPDQQYKLGSAKPIWSTDEWFKEQQQPIDGDSNKSECESDTITHKVLADMKMN